MIVFLDRDGTINELGEGYITDPNKLELIPGSGEAIKIFNDLGVKIIVVTNQSIIGHGKATHKMVRKLHDRLDDLLAEHEAHIDYYLYAPSTKQDPCNLRKPNTGLFSIAKELYDIDLDECLMVGDNKTDVEFARNCGIPAILVKTGHGQEHQFKCAPNLFMNNLLEVAEYVRDVIFGENTP